MNRGFTLLEVIIAMFVVTVGIVGAFAITSRSAVLASNTSSQFVASYLAQEGLEITRNIRDSRLIDIYDGGGGNWDDTLAGCSAGCEADYREYTFAPFGAGRFLRLDAANRYVYAAGTQTAFKRKITITGVPGPSASVTVDVTWTDRGTPKSLSAATILYDWFIP